MPFAIPLLTTPLTKIGVLVFQSHFVLQLKLLLFCVFQTANESLCWTYFETIGHSLKNLSPS